MIWFICLPGLAFISLFVYTFFDNKSLGYLDFADTIFYGLFLGFFGIVFGGIMALILNLCFYEAGHNVPHHHLTQLTSLQDNTSEHGTYFLGIGHTDGGLSIDYYTEDNGVYYPHNLNIDESDVEIVQDATSGTAVIDKISYTTSAPLLSIARDTGAETYVFHVPPGTIEQNYTLDAK